MSRPLPGGRPSVDEVAALLREARRLIVDGGAEAERAAFLTRKAALFARLDPNTATATAAATCGDSDTDGDGVGGGEPA